MLDHEEMNFLQKALPFFRNLDSIDQDMIATTASYFTCLSGEIIFSKEKECKGLIIIKNGRLRALYGLDDGREITLYRLLPKDFCILTTSCILKNIHFEIILEAEKESEIIFIPPITWKTIADKSVAVQSFAMDLLSERLSEIVGSWKQMFAKSVQQRIAAFLTEQSGLENSEVLAITHDTIARNIGSMREVISRSLKCMENDGLLKLSRGKIKLSNVAMLQEMSR